MSFRFQTSFQASKHHLPHFRKQFQSYFKVRKVLQIITSMILLLHPNTQFWTFLERYYIISFIFSPYPCQTFLFDVQTMELEQDFYLTYLKGKTKKERKNFVIVCENNLCFICHSGWKFSRQKWRHFSIKKRIFKKTVTFSLALHQVKYFKCGRQKKEPCRFACTSDNLRLLCRHGKETETLLTKYREKADEINFSAERITQTLSHVMSSYNFCERWVIFDMKLGLEEI